MTKISEFKRVLVIEDTDLKWQQIEKVLLPVVPEDTEIVRAADMIEGRNLIYAGGWDILLLDVSLDIRANGSKNARGNHEFTGGLQLASRMRNLRKEIPTIVITGFETFPSPRPQGDHEIVLGLEDVEREMRKYLGDFVIGLVRHGSTGWEGQLRKFVMGRLVS